MAADGVDDGLLTAPLPGSLVRRTGETSSSVASGAAGPAGQLFEVGRSQPDYARRIAEALERIAVALERMVDGVDAGDEAAEEPGTPLPEGFPGREDLHEAGVFYLECVPRTGPGLALLGLDGRTVNQVLTRLKGDE